jgi:hypothetical protein
MPTALLPASPAPPLLPAPAPYPIGRGGAVGSPFTPRWGKGRGEGEPLGLPSPRGGGRAGDGGQPIPLALG